MAEREGRKELAASIDPAVFRTQRFADEAADIIRHLILSGHYGPGERLNELSLSKELKISRSPIREAIQMLAGEGLVRAVAGRGSYVTSFDVVSVTHLCEVRQALECMGARLAAERATPEQLAALGGLLKRTEDALADSQRPYPRDLDFHQSVLEAAGNPRLIETARGISLQFQLARARSGESPGRAGKAYEEHRRLYEALCQRDADAAEQAMAEHLTSSLQNIKQLLGRADTASAG